MYCSANLNSWMYTTFSKVNLQLVLHILTKYVIWKICWWYTVFCSKNDTVWTKNAIIWLVNEVQNEGFLQKLQVEMQFDVTVCKLWTKTNFLYNCTLKWLSFFLCASSSNNLISILKSWLFHFLRLDHKITFVGRKRKLMLKARTETIGF